MQLALFYTQFSKIDHQVQFLNKFFGQDDQD
jgi:hypothetical protein